ncbi:hypothetical protein KAH43_01530 [Candidatus Bipolaricaulota bacterium]|nr:hypothetical protein [Candidatus Bipolaricaulota bacterium]
MKAEFREYLVSIGITTESLLSRIEALHNRAVALAGNEFDWMFMDEYRDEEGVRHYDTLKLLSKDSLSVAVARVVEEPTFNLAFTGPLARVAIRAKDFDFNEATEQSRLAIHGTHSEDFDATIEYKASGKNCETLYALFVEYLRPRLLQFDCPLDAE